MTIESNVTFSELQGFRSFATSPFSNVSTDDDDGAFEISFESFDLRFIGNTIGVLPFDCPDLSFNLILRFELRGAVL